jgi:tetratricopeptide (TPR) repeat protein
MQQSRELSRKERIIEGASTALYKLRFVLLGFLAVFVVFVVIYLIVGEVTARRVEQSTTIVEAIEDDFNDWLESEEGEARDSGATDLLERIDSVLSKYSRLYAAQRALYIRGSMFFLTGAWEESMESFVELADRFPKSYLAPVALINAATAMEEGERYPEAISLLERVVAGVETPERASALFSLGRLHELQGSVEKAVESYELLLDDHPSSGWTNLARSRIIVINPGRS